MTAEAFPTRGAIAAAAIAAAHASQSAPDVSHLAARRNLRDARSGLHDSDEVLARGTHILVLGPPGIGKTTLLRQFVAHLAMAFSFEGSETRCPILLQGHKAQFALRSDPFLEVAGEALSIRAMIKGLGAGRCCLVLDALDEAGDLADATAVLADLIRAYPALQVVVSCRPGSYRAELADFEVFTLEGLDQAEQRLAIERLFDHDRSASQRVEALLEQTYDLRDMAANPLLLTFMAKILGDGGSIPAVPAQLYADFIDVEMVRDDPELDLPTIGERFAILSEFAARLFAMATASESIEDFFHEAGTGRIPSRPDLRIWLKGNRLLVVDEANRIAFAHRSLLIYFVARHYQSDPATFVADMEFLGRYDDELLRFVAGIMEEVAPMVELLIKHDRLLQAATCVAHGKAANDALADYVAAEIKQSLEPRFFRRLADLASPAPQIAVEPSRPRDRYDQLLDLLEHAGEDELPHHERGARFEAFTSALFEGVFLLVEMNFHTEHGEIDIIMENVGQGPFWNELGGDIFIECKNLAAHSAAHMLHSFANKAALAQVKLAFFVSLEGFTGPAFNAIRTMSPIPGRPLLVPLSGVDIRHALQRRVDLEGFLKDAIRHVRNQGRGTAPRR